MPTNRPPSPPMLQRQSLDPIEANVQFYEVEAVAVEDEPPQVQQKQHTQQHPIYYGTLVEEEQVEDEHW